MSNSGRIAARLLRNSFIVLIGLGAAGANSPTLAKGTAAQSRPAAASRWHDLEAGAKRDGEAVGASVRRAAQRVCTAAKSAGHSVTGATRRALAKTRAALKQDEA